MSEMYLNNLSVISYNNMSYTVSENPEVYSVNNPQLVSSDNSIDYLSPPWMSNTWSYIYYGDWQYNGRNVLKNKIYTTDNNNLISCGFLVNGEQHIYLHGYIWNKAPIIKTPDTEIIPNKTYYIKVTDTLYHSVLNPIRTELNTYYETSGNNFNGTIYMNIKSPSGFDSDGNIIQVDNMLRGDFTKINNTNNVSGYIEGLVNFHNYEILVGGILEGKLNTSAGKEMIISNINLKDYQNKRLSGTIYQIWNISGIIQNINPIPYEIQLNLNNYKAYGWLNGFDNLVYSNKFIENEISGTVLCRGKNKLPTQIFEGDIQINIPTSQDNIIKGHMTKLKQSSIVTGYLDGTVVISDENVNMGGNFIGKVDLNSKQNKFINEMYTSMNLSWISGTLSNTQQLSDSIRKIIDIKNYNTLGRKELIYQNSLYGDNLNKTSKNYDINNKPYLVQTWKIIKYDYDNNSRTNNSLYNQNIIDLKTHLANSEQVRNKQAYNQKYIDYPLSATDGNYYCKWKQINSDIVISILTGNNIEEQINYLAGPYKNQTDAENFIKYFAAIKNMKLSDIFKNTEDNTINYYLEHTNIQI